jgi:hypothetical protein
VNVDPVHDRGPRHAVPTHLIETMASHHAKQEQHPSEPGDQFTRHRRLHHRHSGQLARPPTDLMHPDMVAMAVAALRVIAQQQLRMLASQQGSKLSRRFLNVRAGLTHRDEGRWAVAGLALGSRGSRGLVFAVAAGWSRSPSPSARASGAPDRLLCPDPVRYMSVIMGSVEHTTLYDGNLRYQIESALDTVRQHLLAVQNV